MWTLTVDEILAATGGQALTRHATEVTGVGTDTRQDLKGQLLEAQVQSLSRMMDRSLSNKDWGCEGNGNDMHLLGGSRSKRRHERVLGIHWTNRGDTRCNGYFPIDLVSTYLPCRSHWNQEGGHMRFVRNRFGRLVVRCRPGKSMALKGTVPRERLEMEENQY